MNDQPTIDDTAENDRGPAAARLPGPADAARILEAIRTRGPLVHASMNTVAQPFVANVLTALGADVSMTSAPEEIGEMVVRADVFLLNLGTLDPARRAGADVAVAAAVPAGIPWVLDPVKVDWGPARRAFAEDLLARDPAIVKGNAAEMAALGGAIAAARHTAFVTTGAEDVVEAGARRVRLPGGTPLLARVVATGCAAGAVVAAARAVESDDLVAAAAGLGIWSVAAEIAAEGAPGPGSFAVRLVDSVAALSPDQLAERIRVFHG